METCSVPFGRTNNTINACTGWKMRFNSCVCVYARVALRYHHRFIFLTFLHTRTHTYVRAQMWSIFRSIRNGAHSIVTTTTLHNAICVYFCCFYMRIALFSLSQCVSNSIHFRMIGSVSVWRTHGNDTHMCVLYMPRSVVHSMDFHKVETVVADQWWKLHGQTQITLCASVCIIKKKPCTIAENFCWTQKFKQLRANTPKKPHIYSKHPISVRSHINYEPHTHTIIASLSVSHLFVSVPHIFHVCPIEPHWIKLKKMQSILLNRQQQAAVDVATMPFTHTCSSNETPYDV